MRYVSNTIISIVYISEPGLKELRILVLCHRPGIGRTVVCVFLTRVSLFTISLHLRVLQHSNVLTRRFPLEYGNDQPPLGKVFC